MTFYKIMGGSPAALAVMLFASPALAQEAKETGGFYASGAVGAVFAYDQLINGSNAAGAPRRIITYMKRGTTFALAAGYATKDANWGRVRGELEFARQTADLEALSLNGVDRAIGSETGKRIDTGMVNVFYDTPAFIGPVRLEIGGGLGRSRIVYDLRYNVTATGPAIEIPTNTTQGAYQLTAGLSARVSGGLELFSQFRYMKVNGHKVERFNRTAGTLDSTLDAEYDSKSVTAGLRYVF